MSNMNNVIKEIADYNEYFNYECYPEASDVMIAEDFLVSGECNMFAEILYNLTGFPIKIFTFQNDNGISHHSVVQIDNDKYLDAKGVFSAKEIVLRYGYSLDETEIVDVEDSIFFEYEEDTHLEKLMEAYIKNHIILNQYLSNKPDITIPKNSNMSPFK